MAISKEIGTISAMITQYFHGQNLPLLHQVKSFVHGQNHFNGQIASMASQRGQYYETQYFHGQNLIIAWVKSFVHGQNHFSMGKFFLSMGKFICAWAKSF